MINKRMNSVILSMAMLIILKKMMIIMKPKIPKLKRKNSYDAALQCIANP